MTNEARVRPKQFAQRMGYSIATLYRRIEKGLIDQPKHDGNTVYWLESYVQRIVEGDANAA